MKRQPGRPPLDEEALTTLLDLPIRLDATMPADRIALRRVEDETGRICEVVTVVKRRPMRRKRPRVKRT